MISWNITKACNLNCKHCYRDAGEKDKDELNLNEAQFLLDEIKEAGFKIVVLSGGEPLLRDDVYEIISHAHKKGLRPVLGSNGTLITKSVAKRLKEAGIARVGISLDSKNAAIHDTFRGFVGAFEKVSEAIEALKENNVEFQIHTTVTQHNYKEIESLIDFVVSRGACAYHIFFLIPTGRGKDEVDHIISPTQYYALISKILDRQKELPLELKPVCAPHFIPIAAAKGVQLRFRRGCLAGISYCCILPNGDVHPCPYLPLKLGNVRDKDFSAIWRENEVFTTLRSLNYKGECKRCRHRESCGGCRARAYSSSGDYMDEDYYCVFGHGQKR